MVDVQIKLAFMWVVVTLIYLYGDILRMVAGDMPLGEINGMKATPVMMFGISVLMFTPILMIVLTLTLDYNVNRWVNIIVAVFWILFNLVDIRSYFTRPYDLFLIIVSMIINLLTIWWAWHWTIG
ncbi:MAG: hypothetical protein CUN52_09515 [Phototrophicales bacterium]|jgi:hypothetical protein|nr:MAG: hypothetical protein CUN52_09515 [Phototrophicales bacterium]